jgi:hypothetical protein
MFAGTVSDFTGKRQLTHPEYVLLDERRPAWTTSPRADPGVPGHQGAALVADRQRHRR